MVKYYSNSLLKRFKSINITIYGIYNIYTNYTYNITKRIKYNILLSL